MQFTPAEIVLALVIVVAGLYLVLRKRTPSTPPVPPAPAGPEMLGTFTNLPNRMSARLTALPPAPAPVASADTCSVYVVSRGDNIIEAVKAVRGCRLDLGLESAKNFVDTLPQTLFTGLSKEQGERVQRYLQAAGMTVNLTP